MLTLCLFLGLAVMLDLRLVGITMQQTPVSEVAEWNLDAVPPRRARIAGGLSRQSVRQIARDVQPWLIGSLMVMLISGGLLMVGRRNRRAVDWFFVVSPR